MKTKAVIIPVLFTVFLLASCQNHVSPSPITEPQGDITSLCVNSYGGCAPVADPVTPASVITDPELVDVQSSGGELKVKHLAVKTECAATGISTTVEALDGIVTVYEHLVYAPGPRANCICAYDFYTVIKGLTKGRTYSLKIKYGGQWTENYYTVE